MTSSHLDASGENVCMTAAGNFSTHFFPFFISDNRCFAKLLFMFIIKFNILPQGIKLKSEKILQKNEKSLGFEFFEKLLQLRQQPEIVFLGELACGCNCDYLMFIEIVDPQHRKNLIRQCSNSWYPSFLQYHCRHSIPYRRYWQTPVSLLPRHLWNSASSRRTIRRADYVSLAFL